MTRIQIRTLRPIAAGTAALGVLLALAACAATVATTDMMGKTRETAAGSVLVAPDGRSLYTYDADEPGVSNCTGLCAAAWPPLLAPEDATATDGFTVITRANGDRQWALDGRPLYLYVGDNEPGDITGEGVDGVWHLATP